MITPPGEHPIPALGGLLIVKVRSTSAIGGIVLEQADEGRVIKTLLEQPHPLSDSGRNHAVRE